MILTIKRKIRLRYIPEDDSVRIFYLNGKTPHPVDNYLTDNAANILKERLKIQNQDINILCTIYLSSTKGFQSKNKQVTRLTLVTSDFFWFDSNIAICIKVLRKILKIKNNSLLDTNKRVYLVLDDIKQLKPKGNK